MHPLAGHFLVVAVISAGGMVAACSRQQAQVPALPTPEVIVVTVQPQKIRLTTELPGRTSGYLVSEIRPQVNGLIQKRLFAEGSDVTAGQPLYQIDPAPFKALQESAAANVLAAEKAAQRARAAVGASVANVERQKSTVALAKSNRDRLEDLFKEKAVSASDRDQAVTNVEVAEATLRAAEAQVESDQAGVAAADAAIKQTEAALETARINLAYTKIVAPVAGRIGRSTVTDGATVTAYQPQPLATVQQLDPIYVDVPQSTLEMNRLKRNLEGGRLRHAGSDMNAVRIVLEDGTAYAHEGALKFRDVTVDPTTGSVILRIVVPNPEGILLPGMFVRAVIEEGVDEQAILVPQQAVSRNPRGNPLAMVVDAEGKVQQRILTTDRALGDKWLVTSGLSKGDRVVIEGLQKIRPGVVVKIADTSDPSTTMPQTSQPATKPN